MLKADEEKKYMILIILYVEFAEIASFHGKFGVIQYQVMQLTQITGAV